MAFIRIKKIKGHPYAYLVENRWKGKSSRQKVTGYLGRVVEIPEHNSAPAPNMSGDYCSCVQEVITWQLARLGFRQNGALLTKGKLAFSLQDLHFKQRGKEGDKNSHISIKNHNGFLCHYTLDSFRGFKPWGSDQETGLALAKIVVNAGLDLPKELFVTLFQKAKKNQPEDRRGTTILEKRQGNSSNHTIKKESP